MDHLLAAVDLGSNSFRLSIGRVVQQDGIAQIYAIDRLKESVRLAAGLDDDNVINEEAIERAITILKRFGERLAGFHPNRVRAVATNTFRIARNVAEILPRAEAALGFPIEVIAGQEEARLIFSGITSELPPSANRRLMIDIGGGSTEVIIGKGFQPLHMSSLFMGCVSYTRQFFVDGRITESRMQQAQFAARREFETISGQYRRTGWQEAYGSSGTAKGLLAVLMEGGMSKKGITLEGMEKLKAKLVKDGKVIMSELPGLKHDRSLVLPGGLAIMMAAFHELKIKLMLPGEGALRVGVLYDLLGRDSQHDKRDETVRQFMKRYHVDLKQSARVKRAALGFFSQLGLPDGPDKQELERTLGWVADLHEIGISIAHDDYHKHGAYILQHADMPGFSNDDQIMLSLFALGHQGKLGKLQARDPSRDKWLTLFCLRLAVLLSRRRDDREPMPISIQANGHSIRVNADESWLQKHPLTEFSLQAEKREWNKAGFEFELNPT
ncbi:exopolyphosphatase [Pollutimonas subterranea]|uniref:Exopolyphosphatase n=1 Tax=Pollutimonas subterranea TaxID=2045210 RepID=A0A2N4U8Q1_9BURK|nr:Ppx/GppA phosphatase family protein [Pollutimonas subterranea]PLC51404.1 exopolyphosphatase [Pollutimonas subterranea]